MTSFSTNFTAISALGIYSGLSQAKSCAKCAFICFVSTAAITNVVMIQKLTLWPALTVFTYRAELIELYAASTKSVGMRDAQCSCAARRARLENANIT